MLLLSADRPAHHMPATHLPLQTRHAEPRHEAPRSGRLHERTAERSAEPAPGTAVLPFRWTPGPRFRSKQIVLRPHRESPLLLQQSAGEVFRGVPDSPPRTPATWDSGSNCRPRKARAHAPSSDVARGAGVIRPHLRRPEDPPLDGTGRPRFVHDGADPIGRPM